MPKTFDIDISQLRAFERFLKELPKTAVPHAARNALNEMAFEGRQRLIGRMEKSMTLRNNWTTRGVQIDKARGTDLRTMQAVLGNVRKYADELEEGHTIVAEGKHGVQLPTRAAAGQDNSPTRTRPVRSANFRGAFEIKSAPAGLKPKQRNAISMWYAKKGSGYAYLDLGKRRGIFKVTAIGRTTKQSGPLQQSALRPEGAFRYKLQMIYAFTDAQVKVAPIPTLEQTVNEAKAFAEPIMEKALIEQFKRLRFGTGK